MDDEQVPGGRPVEVTRAVVLAVVLLLLAGAMTVLAVVLDDRILRESVGAGAGADTARAAPSFQPVVVVLYVTVAALVLVLLAFLTGGHDWARHSLAATYALLGVAACALLVSGPLVPFVVLAAVWLALDLVLLVLLYRPGTADRVAPRVVPPARP